jgi:16S rRNA C967 or C1407 C5-methylase (RsmB/RsmF family)
MEPEENEEVVSEVLANASSIKPVTRDEVAKSLVPHLVHGLDAQALIDANAQFRTTPAAQRTDGFFAAVLENTESAKQ